MPSPLSAADQKPWLSVLIPVFNVEAYLDECVDSVLGQVGDSTIEIVLLDDASTDASWAAMQAVQARSPGAQLRLLRHEINQGLSAARNSLLEASRGEYIWFLDSDDKLLAGALAGLQEVVSRHHPDVVLCDFRVWREAPRLKHVLRGERHRHTFKGTSGVLGHGTGRLLEGTFLTGQMHAWSKISRRALWADDLRFPVGAYFEDMATMPRMLLRAQSYVHVPQPWVAYRQRNSSILSTMTQAKALDASRALAPFVENWRQRSLEDLTLRRPQLTFAIAHTALRNCIAAMGFAQRLEPVPRAALERRVRTDFEHCSPLSSAQLLQAYWRRGWWGRYLRSRPWLRCSLG